MNLPKFGIGKLPPAPRADRRPHKDLRHGIERVDNYAWLRADNWREVMRDPSALAADIRSYLEAENAYAEAVMAGTADLQAKLFAEMKGRIKEDDSSVPANDGPFAYYTSYVIGGQHPLFCRRPRGETGGERILLDGNRMAEGHAYFRITAVSHSPNHKFVGYATDINGSEFYDLQIIDAETGKAAGEPIHNTNGGFVWAGDSRTILYTRLDDNHRPRWIYRHQIDGSADADVLVYEEKDAGFFVGIGATQDHRYLLIDAHDHQTSEVRIVNAAQPSSEPRLVAPRRTGHEYSVDHHDGRLVILTNRDGAEDFKIATVPVGTPEPEHWSDIEPHRQGRLIIDMVCYADFLVRLERENGLPRIIIRDWANGGEHAIAFDEEAYSLGISHGYEYDTKSLRFTYSSMTTPAQVFDYDIPSRGRRLRKTQEVPSGHDPADYVTRRVMAPTQDGEQVPISLLYAKSAPLDGSAPLLLYGYGSYGMAMPASFSTNCLSLVDRGFVYAIAHIRGGKDKGYRWYRDGRGEKKTNSFRDFIACGEFLAREKFTSRGNIVAHGGSAGGMLMGAVANMAPDLFRGIIAEVPFVDVLNTMLDDTLPLTPPEWPEWGNPIESERAFRTIAAYSPYDNVAKQTYPHIIALAGLTDPRVTYWEPAKWVARLRALRTDQNLTVLKTNMEAGHAGASGRFDRLKEVALSYAFALLIAGKAGA